MATTIPNLIAAHRELHSDGKLFAPTIYKMVKDGQIALSSLAVLGTPCGWGEDTPRIVRAIRSLESHDYALIEEQEGRLEDVLRDQEVEVSVKLVVRVKPLDPQDEWSIKDRRYNPKDGKPAWDRVQIGRMVYHATASLFMDRISLMIRARHGDALGTTTLMEGALFDTYAEAWARFDELVAGFREMRARGELLPGASGDDPHAAVVVALVEMGWDEPEAREASEATIGEGDREMRIAAAQRWLIQRRPPKALPSPIAPEDDPEERLFRNAAVKVAGDGECSRASLRRDFGLSASRADDLLDRLEAEGVIGPKMGAAPRKATIDAEAAEARYGAEETSEEETDEDESSDFERAASWASGRLDLSIGELKAAIGLEHQEAIVVLGLLKDRGVIDDMGNPRPKVLMSPSEISAMLEEHGGR